MSQIPYVTFIIPSIGRKTLANTIAHLTDLTLPNWKAIVVFDDVAPTITETERIKPIVTSTKLGKGINNAAEVRNFGIKHALTDTYLTPAWFAFVDDDDVLVPNYISNLLTESMRHGWDNLDVVAFSMVYTDGTIRPKDTRKPIEEQENDIGISFACRSWVFTGNNKAKLNPIWFDPSTGEDYQFLMKAKRNGYNIKISNWINYEVSPLGVAEDRKVNCE